MTDCTWTEDEDGNWWTACDNGFVFEEGGPVHNHFNFCPYCGGTLAKEPRQTDMADTTTNPVTIHHIPLTPSDAVWVEGCFFAEAGEQARAAMLAEKPCPILTLRRSVS